MATQLFRNGYSARYTAVYFDGEAGEDPLKQAVLNWPELLELGDKVEMTYVGLYEEFVGENLPFTVDQRGVVPFSGDALLLVLEGIKWGGVVE
jgi:hypothetical protein